MPKRLPLYTRNRIYRGLITGTKTCALAGESRVSARTIQRFRRNFRRFGRLYAPTRGFRRRRRALSPRQELALIEYVDDQPQMYIDELRDWIYTQFATKVAVQTIWRTLRRYNLSLKVVSRVAAQRSAPLRLAFQCRQKQWRADQVICLDESSVMEYTARRKKGWSTVNTPCQVTEHFGRSRRWSVLPALSVDGYITYRIVHGSITTEIFEDFLIEQVLPIMNPYPESRSILVLDNCPIHRSAKVEELAQEVGVLVEFLPPYSPDFNPIEQSFRILKAWLQRYKEESALFEDFGHFIRYGVERACKVDCRGLYKNSGFMTF